LWTLGRGAETARAAPLHGTRLRFLYAAADGFDLLFTRARLGLNGDESQFAIVKRTVES
jgi:hypothetical protein